MIEYLCGIGMIKMAKDKIYHFTASLLVALLLTFLLNAIWGLLIVTTVGIGKELYDKYIQHKRFDLMDLLADVTGGVLGALLITLIKT